MPMGLAPLSSDAPLELIPKHELLNYIMVEASSDFSPLRQEGWTTWSHTVREMAKAPLHWWGDPTLQTGDIFRLLTLLKPVKAELVALERSGLYTDKMFDGWIPSRTFYNVVESKGLSLLKEMHLALSVIQFSPRRDSAEGPLVPIKGAMVPTVQVMELYQGKQRCTSVRLHPALSHVRA